MNGNVSSFAGYPNNCPINFKISKRSKSSGKLISRLPVPYKLRVARDRDISALETQSASYTIRSQRKIVGLQTSPLRTARSKEIRHSGIRINPSSSLGKHASKNS